MNGRRRRLLLRSLAACATAAGLLAAIPPAAGARTTPARPSPNPQAAAAARSAVAQLAIALHAPSASSRNSRNWAGYADSNVPGTTYNSVSGSWTQPSVTCTSATTYSAAWVGIDGFNSSTVEADGTIAECWGGTAFYYTWWEMYPATSGIQIVGNTVQPGDAITASVAKSGTSFTLKLTDSTHALRITSATNSFNIVQNCPGCPGSSIEWINGQPNPIDATLGYALANFHIWNLTGATGRSNLTSGVISTFPDSAITMVDAAGQVMAQPGALNGSGNGFTLTWFASG